MHGQFAPFEDENVGIVELDEARWTGWLDEGERLLQNGLPSLAEARFRMVGRLASASDDILHQAQMGLVDSLIARGLYRDAEGILDSVDRTHAGSSYFLRRSIIHYGLAPFDYNSGVIADFLQKVDHDSVQQSDVSWLYYLIGLVAEADGWREDANESFALAEEFALDQSLAAYFSSARYKRGLLQNAIDPQQALAELEKKIEDLTLDFSRATLIERYVGLVEQFQGVEEAMIALDGFLSDRSFSFTPAEATRLKLIKALLLDASADERVEILESIVRGRVDKSSMLIALDLLFRANNEPTSFIEFLDSIIGNADQHPLVTRLYYVRSQLLLLVGDDLDAAANDARRLLELYPGSDESVLAYRILADVALRKEPPEYRTAAEYMIQYKEAYTLDAEQERLVDQRIGEAYFLNEDYANAADFYRSAFFLTEKEEIRRNIFSQLVFADLLAGETSRAIEVVDTYGTLKGISSDDIWRIEWNIAQSLLGNGDVEEAHQRVRRLISREDREAVSTVLDFKLNWLYLYLSSFIKQVEGLSDQAQALLLRIESLPETLRADSEVNLLRSELMLLYADALVDEGQIEDAVDVLRDIRADHPESSAAERTFLSEASYFASSADFRAAQTILVAQVDRFPEGELAADALYQAAIYAEMRGREHYRDAILILDRLVKSYPEADVSYVSALRQGDLLRLTNDFAGAQLIYENLVNAFPNHPLRHRAELGRADCMVALAEGKSSELSEAAVVLERFLDLPSLTEAQRIEAGHKWGLVLLRQGDITEARGILGRLVARYLIDADRVVVLDRIGQYWLARSVFKLGELLEASNEADEARRLYRLMIALNMPGRNISTERLEKLSTRK